MDLSHHQIQHHQQYQSKSTRNSYTIDAQISHPATHLNINFPELHHHNLGVPPFHIPGFSPYPIATQDVGDAGVSLPWYFSDSEPKKKKLKEQDFWENNSQSSVVDFLQIRSVSTGLGLSLERTGDVSLGDSPSFSFIRDDIDREFQDLESSIDKFLKIQGEEMRRAVVQKVEAGVSRAMSTVEERVKRKLRNKEREVSAMTKRNSELEIEAEQLSAEADLWRQRTHYYDQMIAAMKLTLHRVSSPSTATPPTTTAPFFWDAREGCGDSDEADSASSCNPWDLHLLSPGSGRTRTRTRTRARPLACKNCLEREVGMLLLPCQHLCLCRQCEPAINSCPICHSFKVMGMEVFL